MSSPLPIDNDTFAALWSRYHGPIRSFVVGQTGHVEERHVQADDIVQEVFVKAAQAWGQFDGENVQAWLYRIARNQCIDYHRRAQRLRWVPWEPIAHDHLQAVPAEEERAVIQAETIAAVRVAIAQVSPRHRRALLLREVEGLSCQEIADALGMGRSAVKSMLFRAREEFRCVWRRMEASNAA